jgi:hypothetical protein
MPSWLDRLTSLLPWARRPRADQAIYDDLRTAVLTLDPATLAVAPDEAWTAAAVAVMEIGVETGSATVVTVADGTVSLYLSSGGGVIGAGGHAAVGAAARHFRELIAESRGLLAVVEEVPPLPAAGEVRFHACVGDARYGATAPEAALRSGRHPLASLYAAGQDVLTEIRLASEPVGA